MEDGSMVIFPVGMVLTILEETHQVVLTFPEKDDAVIFYEWCRQGIVRAMREGEN